MRTLSCRQRQSPRGESSQTVSAAAVRTFSACYEAAVGAHTRQCSLSSLSVHGSLSRSRHWSAQQPYEQSLPGCWPDIGCTRILGCIAQPLACAGADGPFELYNLSSQLTGSAELSPAATQRLSGAYGVKIAVVQSLTVQRLSSWLPCLGAGASPWGGRQL